MTETNPNQMVEPRPPGDLRTLRRGEANPDLRRHMPAISMPMTQAQLEESSQHVRVRNHSGTNENIIRDRYGNNVSIMPGQVVDCELTVHDINYFKRQFQGKIVNGVFCRGFLEVLEAGEQPSRPPERFPEQTVNVQEEIPVMGPAEPNQDLRSMRPNQEDEERRARNTDHRPKR